jgi:putative FmdB family regulatory protein
LDRFCTGFAQLGNPWLERTRPLPIYEYRCSSCGTTVEEIQPVGSPAPEACAECGGEVRRIYGRVGVRFSGWGFRRTDTLAPQDRPRKDFERLREKAEEIAEG